MKKINLDDVQPVCCGPGKEYFNRFYVYHNYCPQKVIAKFWDKYSLLDSKMLGQYLKKGSKVYIEGQLQTRKWTDQQGAEKYTTEVVLQNFNSTLTMLDGRSGGSEGGGFGGGSSSGGGYSDNDFGSSGPSSGAPRRQSSAPSRNDMDDDIPF